MPSPAPSHVSADPKLSRSIATVIQGWYFGDDSDGSQLFGLAVYKVAENWGTYVLVHAYTPRTIRQPISAGVRCIEHGQLVMEPTVELMAEKGIRWCLQSFLGDEDAPPLPGPANCARCSKPAA